MPSLVLDESFPLMNFVTEISPNDAMFDSSPHYINVSLSALKVIEYAIAKYFTFSGDPRTILDLPCGHGRCGRVLRSRFPKAELTVCDLDHDGVDFCASRLNARGVYSSTDFDKLDFQRKYDLIWVSSLITHLKVEDTVTFIRRMEHHLSKDGLLVISNHGKFVLDRISSGEYLYGLTERALELLIGQYNLSGYGYVDYHGMEGYGISIISRHWLEGFFAGEQCEIVGYLEHELDDHHDVLFAKRKDCISCGE
jgi:Methyltransferase domain